MALIKYRLRIGPPSAQSDYPFLPDGLELASASPCNDGLVSFTEWTEVLGSERLPGNLLDRLTHHAHILKMNGES